MKVVFFGTPEFAVPSFEALIRAGHTVAAAVTQPDRPGDRGRVTPSPVKRFASRNGIPVLQFERVKRDGVADLKKIRPDIMVTAAYGQILSREILDIPRLGVINVHASLLPAYRGPAPANWAVARGETRTGVTIMRADEGIDTGDMILKKETDVGADETAVELSERLSVLGAEALTDALSRIEKGTAVYERQDESKASYFPLLRRTDGEIDWNMPAKKISDLIRGIPSYTFCDSGLFKIRKAAVCGTDADAGADRAAGTVVLSGAKEGLRVRCGDGVLELLDVQAAGGRAMSAREYLRGRPIPVGSVFCRQL